VGAALIQTPHKIIGKREILCL